MPNKVHDVAVIGAGPGGLTAAAWCSELGLETILIERSSACGGQLHSVFNPINNYPGVSASNGAELASLMERSFSGHSFERRFDSTVTGVDTGEVIGLRFDENSKLYARFVIFAAGLSRKTLNIPGEAEFIGKGVLRSGVGEKHLVEGKRLVIIGGGDAALENAMILSKAADSVVIVHRRDSFSAQERFISGVQSAGNVEFMMNSVVQRIEGDEKVENVMVTDTKGVSHTIPADLVLIRIGFKPNSELLAGVCGLDENGYVIVDRNAQSSVPNVYAVGDVASPVSPTIVTAAGMGAVAARSIFGGLRR